MSEPSPPVESLELLPLDEALRRSDSRLNFCLDTAEIGLWEMDFTTGQVSRSLRHDLIFGYDSAQANWTIERFLSHVLPEDRAHIQASIRRQIVSSTQLHAEMRIQRADGELCWIETRGRVMRDESDRPIRLLGTTRDVTERKRLEEALTLSEAHYRSMTDSVPSIALMATIQGGCQYLNQRWYDYTGLTEAESLGRGWTRVIHPDDLEQTLRDFRAAVAAEASFETEYRFRGRDGLYRWFLGRIVPVRDADGKMQRYFGTLTDIDRQKQTEETLRQRQQEVDALNARLRRAMQETHHRVKNNLQVISSLIEMQQDQMWEARAKARKQPEPAKTVEALPFFALNRVGQHVRTLAAVHDLLTLQARGDADLTHISTRPLLNKLVTLIESTLDGRRLQTDIDDVPLSVKDGAALGLLINELISNAVKHGRRDILLTLRREEEDVRLAVSDDGAGFPPGFDPQRAAHTGLELIDSIARWDLRGEVTYLNGEHGGAQVVVIFPLPAAD